jgi:FMN phosphatase YigB (HAD superfamily)
MEAAAAQGILTAERPILCKPAPASFQLVLDALGAEAASTIFIDDSVRNVAAAHALGVYSVLVSPTLAASGAPHQQVAGADLVLASFNQLREVLPQVGGCCGVVAGSTGDVRQGAAGLWRLVEGE